MRELLVVAVLLLSACAELRWRYGRATSGRCVALCERVHGNSLAVCDLCGVDCTCQWGPPGDEQLEFHRNGCLPPPPVPLFRPTAHLEARR